MTDKSTPQRLHVSDNRRFLQRADGTPFFYLADTAWELFHRLTFDEASAYLELRAAQGFTVIQCVALAELDGIRTPNANGDTPFAGDGPGEPSEAYWAHVDRVVVRINELGLVAGFLPTWGDKWNRGAWGAGPVIFNEENARTFGAWLGARYQDADLIWILGGDRACDTPEQQAIIRAMAQGLANGDGGAHLRTFHPQGQQTSATHFHSDDWLDFNMYQTGHTFDRDNYASVAEDYARTPAKPCLDSEPGYEDHPNSWKPETGYLDAYECRKFLWWAALAGACGHTYGCHDIWQFYDPSKHGAGVSWARTSWRDALQLPGAGQMQHAKNALLARPYFSRVPDQSAVVSDTFDDELRRTHHIQASRDENGAFVIVYSASGQAFTVDLTKLAGRARGAWLNPRTGKTTECGEYDNAGTHEFTPPSRGRGHDWALTLDAIGEMR